MLILTDRRHVGTTLIGCVFLVDKKVRVTGTSLKELFNFGFLTSQNEPIHPPRYCQEKYSSGR